MQKIIPYLICLIIAILGFLLGYNYRAQQICQTPNCLINNKSSLNSSEEAKGQEAVKQKSIENQGWLAVKVISFDDKSIKFENLTDKKIETVDFSKNVKFSRQAGTKEKPVIETISKPNFKPGDLISINVKDALVSEILYNPPPVGDDH